MVSAPCCFLVKSSAIWSCQLRQDLLCGGALVDEAASVHAIIIEQHYVIVIVAAGMKGHN